MGVSGRFWTPAVSRAAPVGNSFKTLFLPIISKLLLHRYYRRPTDGLNGYDLVKDPAETTNLIDSPDPGIRKQREVLNTKLPAKMRSINDPALKQVNNAGL